MESKGVITNEQKAAAKNNACKRSLCCIPAGESRFSLTFPTEYVEHVVARLTFESLVTFDVAVNLFHKGQ